MTNIAEEIGQCYLAQATRIAQLEQAGRQLQAENEALKGKVENQRTRINAAYQAVANWRGGEEDFEGGLADAVAAALDES